MSANTYKYECFLEYGELAYLESGPVVQQLVNAAAPKTHSAANVSTKHTLYRLLRQKYVRNGIFFPFV